MANLPGVVGEDEPTRDSESGRVDSSGPVVFLCFMTLLLRWKILVVWSMAEDSDCSSFIF